MIGIKVYLSEGATYFPLVDNPFCNRLSVKSDTYLGIIEACRISYATSDAALVAAIHDWFATQLSDHGADAMSH